MEKWITVVIPVYNTEKYLEECLSSVVKQTIFNKLEIICIDDASPDKSSDILKKYNQNYKNIKVINLSENVGVARARNIGINEAKGEYIAFLDSDDFVDITMYEKLYIKAKENNYDIVECDYFEYSSGKIKYSSGMENITGKIDIEKRRKLVLNSGGHSLKIYKLELLKNKKIRFPENLFYEDNYFVPIAVFNCETISKVEEALYYYRRDNMNSTTKKKDNYKFFDRLITAKMLLNDMKKINNQKYNNMFVEEIEFIFIKLYYRNSLEGAINFSKYPKKYVNEIIYGTKKILPNFKENIYFKKFLKDQNIKGKIRSFLLFNFPKLMWINLKIKKKLRGK